MRISDRLLKEANQLSHFLSLIDSESQNTSSPNVDVAQKLPNEMLDKLNGSDRLSSMYILHEYLLRMEQDQSFAKDPYIARLHKSFLFATEICYGEQDNFLHNKYLAISSSPPSDSYAFNQEIASCLNAIKENKLVALPGGWKDHSVGIAFIGNRLIVTNTGEGSEPTPGTFIYEIDPNLVDQQWIKDLLKAENKEEHAAIIQKIKINDQFIFNAHRSQKVGNCSISNPKKGLEEMIACLKAFDECGSGQLTTEAIQKALNSDAHDSSLFKKITHKMRDYALEDYKKAVETEIDDAKKFNAGPEALQEINNFTLAIDILINRKIALKEAKHMNHAQNHEEKSSLIGKTILAEFLTQHLPKDNYLVMGEAKYTPESTCQDIFGELEKSPASISFTSRNSAGLIAFKDTIKEFAPEFNVEFKRLNNGCYHIVIQDEYLKSLERVISKITPKAFVEKLNDNLAIESKLREKNFKDKKLFIKGMRSAEFLTQHLPKDNYLVMGEAKYTPESTCQDIFGELEKSPASISFTSRNSAGLIAFKNTIKEFAPEFNVEFKRLNNGCYHIVIQDEHLLSLERVLSTIPKEKFTDLLNSKLTCEIKSRDEKAFHNHDAPSSENNAHHYKAPKPH